MTAKLIHASHMSLDACTEDESAGRVCQACSPLRSPIILRSSESPTSSRLQKAKGSTSLWLRPSTRPVSAQSRTS